jgi:hypothetical protein
VWSDWTKVSFLSSPREITLSKIVWSYPQKSYPRYSYDKSVYQISFEYVQPRKIFSESMKINSCDIVALRENFVDRPESYDSFSAKSCVFHAHGLGVYFSTPLHNVAQSKVSKFRKTFTYYSRTITNLTKFDFPLPRDQRSRSRIWQMISEKFKCVTFKAALDDVRYL